MAFEEKINTDREVYNFKIEPYRHQKEVWKETNERIYHAIFWEMGTGKSKLIMDIACHLYKYSKIDSLVIIANKGSYLNWVDKHIPLHMWNDIPYFVTYWDSSQSTKLEKTYPRLLSINPPELKIFVMNVEALAYKKGVDFLKKFITSRRCLGVVDESTSIKNPKALRTKSILALSRLFKYRRIMTGSPVTNGVLNLYTQAEFLSPCLLGHTSWYSFRYEFCEMIDLKVNRMTFKKVVGFKNLDRLKARMKDWSSIIRKEDCLTLPDKIYETYKVELTDEQIRIYEELRKRSVAELSEGYCAVSIVLTKLLRLQQVLCGFVPNENETTVEIAENRTEKMMEVIEEMNGKVIIWSRFVKSIQRICNALKKEYGDDCAVEYYGATETDDRRNAVQQFQEGKPRFFVGNPQTGGYGITLTAASNVIYYANSFDLEIRMQSEDRCHRIGQNKTVTYVDLCSPKTVDEKIIKALQEKRSISDLIMDPLDRMDLLSSII